MILRLLSPGCSPQPAIKWVTASLQTLFWWDHQWPAVWLYPCHSVTQNLTLGKLTRTTSFTWAQIARPQCFRPPFIMRKKRYEAIKAVPWCSKRNEQGQHSLAVVRSFQVVHTKKSMRFSNHKSVYFKLKQMSLPTQVVLTLFYFEQQILSKRLFLLFLWHCCLDWLSGNNILNDFPFGSWVA